MIFCRQMTDDEASAVLSEVVRIETTGTWIIRHPLYFSPSTEGEVFNFRVVSDEDEMCYLLPSDELYRHLNARHIGFDWTELYFFAESLEAKAVVDDCSPGAPCQFAAQCIDASDWFFETKSRLLEEYFQSRSELFKACETWGNFPPRYPVCEKRGRI